jgi:class 3 adenylate cyclase
MTESYPLPAHPALAAWASALNEAGHWANVLDARFRYVYQTDELRKTFADMGGRPSTAVLGFHLLGDGVTAYFLAETAGSESVAARSCITAARKLQELLTEIAARSDIPESGLSLRFGLHWGSTLYIGRILTGGRSEVTALGDEANEAARIEACATGGQILASKDLVERLDRADADALGLDTSRAGYTLLGELPTATEKARRDAPAIAVCDLTDAS